MLAVIRTGGKQYLVSPGQKIKIEKIDKKEGSEITFKEVLLLEKELRPTRHPPAKGGPLKIEIGNPLVKGAKVIGKILRHSKGKKVIVLKYKTRKRYKIKKGHRQPFTEVKILKIEI